MDPINTSFVCNSKNLKDLGVNVFADKFGKGLKLTSLNLSSNIIEVLHKNQFIDLIELLYLYLENNNISTIGVDLFRYNIKLTKIYLTNNNINKFDFKLRRLQQLDTLMLANNHLTTLNEDVFKYFLDKENENNAERTLDVINNRFTCDCSMTWIRNVNKLIDFNFTSEYMCTSDISEHISLSCFMIKYTYNIRCLNNKYTDCITTERYEIR